MPEFLANGFIWPGLAAAVAVGAMCGAYGVIQGFRSSALAGDALAHAALPGVVAAWLVSGSSHPMVLAAGALMAGVVAATWSGAIRSAPRSRADAAIAIPLVAAFGLGALLLSAAQRQGGSAAAGLGTFLLGNAAAVGPAQAATVVLGASVVLVGLARSWRGIATVLLDGVWAQTQGLQTGRVQQVLDAVLAVVVVLSIRTVGVLLVAAMLVVPAAAALQVARRLPRTMLIAAGVGAASGAAGVAASVSLPGVATGPAMALSAGCFVVIGVAYRLVESSGVPRESPS